MDQQVPLRLTVVSLVAALALAGCGRKGPLEAPSAPQAQAAPVSPAAEQAQARVLPPVGDPSLIQPPTATRQRTASAKLKDEVAAPPPPINTGAPQGGKSFVLDPLL